MIFLLITQNDRRYSEKEADIPEPVFIEVGCQISMLRDIHLQYSNEPGLHQGMWCTGSYHIGMVSSY